MPVTCIEKSHAHPYFTEKITPAGVKQSISFVKHNSLLFLF